MTNRDFFLNKAVIFTIFSWGKDIVTVWAYYARYLLNEQSIRCAAISGRARVKVGRR